MIVARIRFFAAVTMLAACSDSTGPNTLSVQFGEPLSLAQFESEIAGTARIEIEFTTAAGLVAREIEVEPDDAEEKFVSRIIDIDATTGAVTLELGNFVVSYNSSTRFRTPSNSDVARASWETLVEEELDAGRRPAVEVRRDQPAGPQAPTVATFTADDLRVVDDFDDAKIEVYVDADNFQDVSSPPPEAILRVFNLPVQILSSTRIQRVLDGPPQNGTVQFEGQVSSVSPVEGRMTLVDGTVIQTASATTFDPDGDVFGLATTADALADGDIVRLEGTGSIQSVGPPRTIAATRVKIEVDD